MAQAVIVGIVGIVGVIGTLASQILSNRASSAREIAARRQSNLDWERDRMNAAYVDVLAAAHEFVATATLTAQQVQVDITSRLMAALAVVEVLGPDPVYNAASDLTNLALDIRNPGVGDQFAVARSVFASEARKALAVSPRPAI